MIDADNVLTEQGAEYRGITGISETGSLVAIGKENGQVALFTGSGSSGNIDAPTTRSASHIQISENGPRRVIGSMDGGVLMGFDGSKTWTHRYDGLWNVEPVHEMNGACACARPREGTGSVRYIKNGEEEWRELLEDSTALRVSASEDASGIAVGTGQYYLDEEPLSRFGTPGIIFYEWGEREWFKETSEDVIGLAFNPDDDCVTAGLDDGSLVSYNLSGELLFKENGVFKSSDKLWKADDEGGFISVSGDRTLIVSHALGVLRCFDTRGSLQWEVNASGMARDEQSVQVDETGDRVLVTTIEGNAYLVESGNVIWTETTSVGPIWGSLSEDGSTWCVTVENLDTQVTTLDIYCDS